MIVFFRQLLAAILGPDAAAPGLRAQLIDGGEQFVILTDKILGAHGEKLLVEGREFAAVDFGSEDARSEEHTSELQSQSNLVCRLLLEKKNRIIGLLVVRFLLGR